jgi:translocation and assembly module TamB
MSRRRLFAVTVGIVLIVCSVGVLALVATGPGARLVVGIVLPRLPIDMTVAEVQGRLLGPLTTTGVRLKLDAVEITADTVALDWRPLALLRPHLVIDWLDVVGLIIAVDTTSGDRDTLGIAASEAAQDTGAALLPFPIEFGRLSARRAAIDVPGVARVDGISLQAGGSSDAFLVEGRARAMGPSLPEVVARFAGSGDLRQATLERLEARTLDGLVIVSGTVTWLPELSWDVSVEADSIAYGQLLDKPEAWPGRAFAAVSSAGNLEGYQLVGSVRGTGPRLPPSDIHLAGRGTQHGFEIDSAAADILDGRARVQGAVTWTAPAAWDLEVALDGLAYGPLLNDAAAWPGTVSALLRSAGTTEGYRVDGSVRGAGPRLPPSELLLAGHGTTHGFDIENAVASMLRGRAEVSGAVTWSPEVVWDLAVALEEIQPAPLFADSTSWPGAVTLFAASAGRLEGASRLPVAAVVLDSVRGTLRGQPVGGQIDAEVRGRTIDLTDSWLTWGAGRVTASGAWADTVSGRFSVDLPRLEDFHPALRGRFLSEGRASGRRSAYRIDATVEGDGLALDSLALAAVGGRVAVAVDSLITGEVTLGLTGFSAGGFAIDSANIDMRGSTPEHTVQVAWSGSHGDLLLDARGGVADAAWTGTLERLELARADIGAAVLTRPARVAVSETAVSVDSLCLAGDVSSLCGAGTWHRSRPWSAVLTLESVPLAGLDPVLPDRVSLTGVLGGEIRAAGNATGALDASIDLSTGPGEVRYPVGRETRALGFQPVQITAAMGDSGLTAQTDLVLLLPEGAEIATVSAALGLPDYRRLTDSLASQPLRGRLDARIDDVSLIRAIDPEITAATGRIVADLQFEGTLQDPVAVGEARLEEGTLEVRDLGITVRDINVVASGNPDGSLEIRGQMTSGGTLAVTGRSPVVPSVREPATLTIRGEGFQVADLPEASIVVSPDLTVSMTRDSVDVTGTVALPKAVVELTEAPVGAVTVSNDVVFVDADSVEVRGPLTVTSSVLVELGDTVSFRGFGFRAALGGSFRVEDRPGEVTTGTGTITITRGRYRAYGQDLTIENGRVLFNGPVDDPGLDVRAFREARDRTIAGLDVRGTLKAPIVTVFSNPPMSQSEAMSYLMFGRAMEQGSASEQNRMADAAAALGGDMLAQSIGAKLGLEAGLEQGANASEAAFVAGTYLSPSLYVAYGVGLFERVNIFRVRYDFTRRWSVQAESSRESSADVFFNFERK